MSEGINMIIKHSFNIRDLMMVKDMIKINEDGRIFWYYIEDGDCLEAVIEDLDRGLYELTEILTSELIELEKYVLEGKEE